MLIRISLIIAIVAALAVGVLNFVKVKEKITTLVTERNDWHTKFTKTDEDLTRTKGELDKTAKDLKQTKDTLELTSAELVTAKAEAEAQTKKATELADKLAKTTEERTEAQQKLAAYVATGRTPEQIITFDKQIKQAQEALEVAMEEKRILSRNITRLNNQLKTFLGDDTPITMPAKLKGKILTADPKWDFVVLDVGEEDGVLENGELLVSRGGKLVAKVIISNILSKNRSIANVLPGWKLADLLEGDQVIAAHPAS